MAAGNCAARQRSTSLWMVVRPFTSPAPSQPLRHPPAAPNFRNVNEYRSAAQPRPHPSSSRTIASASGSGPRECMRAASGSRPIASARSDRPATAGEPDRLGKILGTPSPFSRWHGTQFCAYSSAPRSGWSSTGALEPAAAPGLDCWQAPTAKSSPQGNRFSHLGQRAVHRILAAPGAKGTGIQMHEIRPAVIPDASALQVCGVAPPNPDNPRRSCAHRLRGPACADCAATPRCCARAGARWSRGER